MVPPTRPIILAFDTTTPVQALALASGGRLLEDCTVRIATSHTETLLLRLDELLVRHRLSGAGLDGLAAVTGPGSFTGIRIGLAAAQGLADGWSKPLIGLHALELLALHPGLPDGPVCTSLAAGRGGVYAAAYQRASGRLTVLCAPLELHPGDDSSPLAAWPDMTFFGSGTDLFPAALIASRPVRIPPPSGPSVAGLLALEASRMVAAGEVSTTRPEAFYVRPPDAKKSTRWRDQPHGR
jgi:tRNA threonylcarbamoyladenosine biosynthesis protein TsaB